MTDLHTHILPEMDDGAHDVQTSLEMLRMEASQGIDTVVLTPHFYRYREDSETFFSRRQRSYELLLSSIEALSEAERLQLPNLRLGTEVAWMPNLSSWPDLDRLCYQNTKYIMVELPMDSWSDDMFNQLYNMINRTGLTPVIAHIDRYLKHQKREHLDLLFDLGVPVQISSDAFLDFISRSKSLALVRSGAAEFLISDCHSLHCRSPNIGAAMEVISRKLGKDCLERISQLTDTLLLV